MIGCGRCAAQWSGSTSAHCAGCHATFASVKAFDYHRRGGVCTAPGDCAVTVDGVRTAAPLVLAERVYVPGAPGHYRERGYPLWTFEGEDA